MPLVMEKPWDLRERTILFGVSVIRFCRHLPGTKVTKPSTGSMSWHVGTASKGRKEEGQTVQGELSVLGFCGLWFLSSFPSSVFRLSSGPLLPPFAPHQRRQHLPLLVSGEAIGRVDIGVAQVARERPAAGHR